MQLTLHHVGCLVEDIPAALASYAGTHPHVEIAAPVAVRNQKVTVCFLPVGNGTFIEFVKPDPDNTILHKLLRAGTSYYHVGYLCANLDETVKSLMAAGAHELVRFQSEAFAGRYCVFLVTNQHQLIELIESE